MATGVEGKLTDVKEELDRDGGNALARSKLACEACRANKVRCIREGSEAACIRCSRYGISCSDPLIQKKRGRPPKGQERRKSSLSPPPSLGRNPSYEMTMPLPPNGMYPPPARDYHPPPPDPGPSTYAQSQGQGQAYNPYPIPGAIFNQNPMMPPAQAHIQNQQDQLQHQQQHQHPGSFLNPPRPPQQVAAIGPSPDSIITTSTPRSGQNNLDLSEYLDPTDKVEPKLPFFHNNPGSSKAHPSSNEDDPAAAGRMSEGEDPVSLSMLSIVEANALVQLFHERLNPHVAVLDHQLHSLRHLRRSSTVLFSSVLAAAARFFRKDLHRRLLAHAQTILDRALTAGASDIGIVQSLMILTYWKSPADTSAWRKIGMAIRIGYQSFWHVPRAEPLPDDELAARHILNAERTWYCLFCFDRGLSQTFGLPTTLRMTEIGDPEIWAREHVHLGPSVDMHLAASMELCKLKDHWKSIFDAGAPSPVYVESAIDTMLSQAEALVARYFTKEAPPPNFEPDKERVIMWSILDFIHILHRHRLELAPQDPLRLDMCLASASKCVDEIELLAETGPLPIMQDTGSCMTSSLIVFFRKGSRAMFRECSRSQKTLIVTLLQRILLSHSRVSDGDDDMATAYVARFTRRILGVVGQESRAASPRMFDQSIGNVNASANPNGNGNGHPPPESDFMAELEQFLQMPDNVVQNELKDQEYWSMLFSADPSNNFASTPNFSFPSF